MECPNCKTELCFVPGLANEQIVYMQIDYEGDMLSARTVWSTIQNMEKVFLAIGKDLKIKTSVFIKSIEQTEHQLKIGFLVTHRATTGAD